MKSTLSPMEEAAAPSTVVFPKSKKSTEPEMRQGQRPSRWEIVTVMSPSGIRCEGYIERVLSKRVHILVNGEWRALSVSDLTEVKRGEFHYTPSDARRESGKLKPWEMPFNGITWQDMPSQSDEDEVAKKLLFTLYRMGATTIEEEQFIHNRRHSIGLN